MRRYVLFLLLPLLLVVLDSRSAFAQQKIVREKIALRFVIATKVVDYLKTNTSSRYVGEGRPNVEEPLLPPGIASVLPNKRDNSLTLRGTAEAVARLKETIRLLDIQPREVTIKLRLVRVPLTPSDEEEATPRSEEVIGAPILVTLNNQTGRVAVRGRGGYEVEITPRINGDNSVTLSAELRLLGLNNQVVSSARGTRRVTTPGERLLAVSDAANTRIVLEATPAETTKKLPATP